MTGMGTSAPEVTGQHEWPLRVESRRSSTPPQPRNGATPQSRRQFVRHRQQLHHFRYRIAEDDARRPTSAGLNTAIMNILRSESTGSIHMSSKAPNMPPAIRFNFLSAQLDREVTLEAMRITRRIMTAQHRANLGQYLCRASGAAVQAGEEVKFAADSLLEGGGFELV